MQNKYVVLVQLKNKKAWNFLKTDGSLSKNKIHAVVYPSKETAESEVNHINKNYAEFYNAKLGEI